MTRPLPNPSDIVSGQQGWDAFLRDILDAIVTNPFPPAEYANFAALPTATSYDRCLAVTTDTNSLYMSVGGLWLGVQVGSDQAKSVVSTGASSFTITTEDVLLVDATIAAATITLPAAVSGRQVVIKKTDVTSNTVTIEGDNPSEGIDGQQTVEILFQYEAITVVTDGSQWYIV